MSKDTTGKLVAPKVLTYDTETPLLPFWAFRPGTKVHLSHKMMMNMQDIPDMLCITYQFLDEDKAHCLRWDPEKGEDSSKIIAEFDKIVKTADITLGQNSDSFDVKHINTQRMIHDLHPLPEWASVTDDLLKQVKANFNLPSNRLDYMSSLLGLKGKNPIELQDWVNIAMYIRACRFWLSVDKDNKSTSSFCMIMFGKKWSVVRRDGRQSFDDMCTYGLKDASDTVLVWKKFAPHFKKPKFNLVKWYGNQDGNFLICKHCGSKDLTKNGTDIRKTPIKQKFYCNGCNRDAGRAKILKAGFGPVE